MSIYNSAPITTTQQTVIAGDEPQSCPCGHEFEAGETYWYSDNGFVECDDCHADQSDAE
jgi:hypothetical protein